MIEPSESVRRQRPPLRQRLIRRLVTTLAAWIAAYATVGAVFIVGGSALADAPLAVRLLVVSGVLVVIMVNVLMPALARPLDKLLAARPVSPSHTDG
jgi:antibiotic biosynthesis monooxygenase (ABM) superfamily enzyme